MSTNKLRVEVVYATPDKQCVKKLAVAENTTIEEAIFQSGIINLFPEITLQQQKVGVFAKLCALSDHVCEGDRIEIYRNLIHDPKETRRKRAKKRVSKTA